jgi:hypothetical protein
MAGSVKITLDVERELRLDINALCEADKIDSAGVSAYLTGQHIGLSAIRALLWAGLNAANPSERVTLAQAGELMQAGFRNGSSLLTLIEVIRHCVQDSGIWHSADDAKKNSIQTDQNGSALVNG